MGQRPGRFMHKTMARGRVEEEREAIIIPNISYKIEF
jgi:hypothetical protein